MDDAMSTSTWVRATLSRAEVDARVEIAAQGRFASICRARGAPSSWALWSGPVNTADGSADLYLSPDAASCTAMVLPPQER
jgi:hypothetical protein